MGEMVEHRLDSIESGFIVHALRQWGGPTIVKDMQAKGMGFASVDDLYRGCREIITNVQSGYLCNSDTLRCLHA